MVRKIFYSVLLLFVTLTYSQIGGKNTYQFLNLGTSPRQAALGGKTITIYDYDVNQANFNPATINSDMDGRLAINYGSYFGESTYGTASYAHTFDRSSQTFHAGVNYINYGQFEGYDENGSQTSSFSGSEIALSLGYAYNVPNSNLHIGASGKLISSALESYNSFGVAVDLGAIYIDKKKNINYAIVIRNVGTQITKYAEADENLPMEIIAGISQELENVPVRWHLTLENLQQWNISFSNPNRAVNSLDGETTQEKVSIVNNAMRHLLIGAEIFPTRSFNVRLGYNFRRGEELKLEEQRNFSGLSVGFGLKMGKLKFDYSYSRYTLAANTSLFGLTINLSGKDKLDTGDNIN